MSEASRVFIVDDDPTVREFLCDYLTESGFDVAAADGGPALRRLLEQTVPHVVLLDVGLPGEDGLTLARFVRERFDVGIIIVSGAGETVDRIVGLEVGADDYISKPFEPRELRARLKSVVRRYQRSGNSTETGTAAEGASRSIRLGDCTLDMQSQRLLDGRGEEVPITNMEFDLLRVFVEHPNRPLSRDQLLNLTQNRDWDPFDRSIDIRITRLRRKIEADPNKPRILKTVRGVGYMFVP